MVRASPKKEEHRDVGTDPRSPRARPPCSVTFAGDGALVAGVRARNPAAMAELHDRFARPVLRVLTRILGPDHELADVHHDVFVRALQSLDDLRDPEALPSWMVAIAVRTAHATIERRARRRKWLAFWSDEAAPEPAAPALPADNDFVEAVRSTYAVLERIPAEERIAFSLRYIDGMELTQVAAACGVSLATIKRRLSRAEARFQTMARRTPALAGYLSLEAEAKKEGPRGS